MKSHGIRIVRILLALLFISGSAIQSDVITLKNGQKIYGKVFKQSRTTIWIKTEKGVETYQKRISSRLNFGDFEDPEALKERQEALLNLKIPVVLTLKSEQKIDAFIVARNGNESLEIQTDSGILKIDFQDIEDIQSKNKIIPHQLPLKKLPEQVRLSSGQIISKLNQFEKNSYQYLEAKFQANVGIISLEKNDFAEEEYDHKNSFVELKKTSSSSQLSRDQNVVLYLSSGQSIEGKIIHITKDDLLIETDSGIYNLYHSDVQGYQFKTTP